MQLCFIEVLYKEGLISEESDEIEIMTEIDGINIFVSDEYYLAAYQKFRDELLKLEYGLKCNGYIEVING